MPPLVRQVLELPVLKGMDQGIDRRLLPADGGFARLENVVVDHQGAAHKRSGYGALPTDVVPSSFPGSLFPAIVSWMDVRQDEMVIRGRRSGAVFPWGQTIDREWSWSPQLAGWKEVDYVTTCSTSSESITNVAAGAVLPRVCITSDFCEVWLWQQGQTLGTNTFIGPYFKAIDTTTKATIHSEDFFPGANWIEQKCVAVDTTAVFLGNKNLSVNIEHLTYTPSTDVTAGAGIIAVTNYVGAWDACEVDAGRFALVYNGPGASDITISTYTAAGVVVQTNTITVANNVRRLSIAALAGVGFRVVYGTWNGAFDVVELAFADITLALQWSTVLSTGLLTTIAYVAVAMDATAGSVGLWQDTVTGGDPVFSQQLAPGGALTGVLMTTAGTVLRSKPFAVLNRFYAIADPYHTGDFYTLNLCVAPVSEGPQGWAVEGIFGEGQAYTAFVDQSTVNDAQILPEVPQIRGTRWLAPIELQRAAGTELVPGFVTTNASYAAGVTFDFADQQAGCPLGVQYQNCLARSGAQVGWYDGESDTELTFVQRPHMVFLPPLVPGAIPAGTYVYKAVFEWIDDQGNLHQSDTSDEMTVTIPAGPAQNVSFTVTMLGTTRKGRDSQGKSRSVQLAIYRTESPGTIFYRLFPPGAASFNGTSLLNDTTIPFRTYTDNVPSSLALGFGQIYTSGEVLANRTLPGSTCVTAWGNRLWSASADDSKTLWFSKLTVQGEGPGFSEALTLRVDDAIDSVTAMAPMDDKLVIFTGQRIYYVSGDGPNDTGAGGVFNGPNRVTTDAGCVDARSVVSYPNGVFYASPAGIYEISRSLQVTPKGLPVLDETTGCAYLSTWLDAVNKRILWLVTGGSEAPYTGPRVLVYDYAFDVWCVWIPYQGARIGSSPDASLSAQVIWEGQHLWSTFFAVQQQGIGPAPWLDNGAYFRGFYESPWIHMAGVAGYQRCYRITVTGREFSAHNLVLEVLTDYDEATVLQTRAWDAATLQNAPRVERVSLHVRPQLSTAIKIRLYDTAPAVDAGAGPIGGFDMAGIAFEVGVKGGSARLPATNRG